MAIKQTVGPGCQGLQLILLNVVVRKETKLTVGAVDEGLQVFLVRVAVPVATKLTVGPVGPCSW